MQRGCRSTWQSAGDPKVYAFNSGLANDRWTADPGNQLDWDGSPVNLSYTFYSANWLNWRSDTSSFVTLSRLQIVQDVASKFVSSISGVNIGLMRYSNNGDGAGRPIRDEHHPIGVDTSTSTTRSHFSFSLSGRGSSPPPTAARRRGHPAPRRAGRRRAATLLLVLAPSSPRWPWC